MVYMQLKGGDYNISILGLPKNLHNYVITSLLPIYRSLENMHENLSTAMMPLQS